MAAPTSAQRAAARNLQRIAGANAQTVKDELARQVAIYDQADAQATQAADVQNKQASKKTAGERFLQNKKLQTSATGLMAAAGNALQGSSARAVGDMLRTRTDLDTTEALDVLRGNRDAINDELYSTLNQNVNARNEAASKAETALRGIESDTAAQLNDINPSLFVAPGTGSADFDATGYAKPRKTKSKTTPVGGYILGDDARASADALHRPAPRPRPTYPFMR